MKTNPTLQDVETLWTCLARNGSIWSSARKIYYSLKWDDRHIRAVASASQGRIIGGQKGYAITALCDEDEVHHVVARLRSQAKRMNKRAKEIEKLIVR